MEDLLILIADKSFSLSTIIRGHSLAYWHLKKAKDEGFQQVAMCVYDLSIISPEELHGLVCPSFRPLVLAAETLAQQLARVQMNYGEHRSCILANMRNYLTVPYSYSVASTIVFSDRNFSRSIDNFVYRSVEDFAELYSPKQALLDNRYMWIHIMSSSKYIYEQTPYALDVVDDAEKLSAAVVSSRAFNSINIDVSRGIVCKTSSKKTKLKAESKWYNSLPTELMGFVPNAISYVEGQNEDMLTMEYCPFPTLSELYVSEVRDVCWRKIIDRLLEVHKMFRESYSNHENYQDDELENDCKVFYVAKTKERYQKLKADPNFEHILCKSELSINGQTYKNIDPEKLYTWMHKYRPSDACSIVHGDYCLSNILMDLKSEVVKLIDPRGILDNCMCVIGDPYYDLAKLDHSVYGLYDYIVAGKYSLSIYNNEYELKIPTKQNTEDLSMQVIAGGNSAYIRTLEASLFLSMIPLHYEDQDRQLAFYLRAVQLYNELL